MTNNEIALKKLIVVAGPPACGKTWLIDRLFQDQLPDVGHLLGIGRIGDWEFTHALRISNRCYPRLGKAIMHYDLWRTVSRSEHGLEFSRDHVLHWMRETKQVLIVTCIANAATLRTRLRQRLPRYLWAKTNALLQGTTPHLHSPMRPIRYLGNPNTLEILYTAWFRYCAGIGITEHWQLDTLQPLLLERRADGPGSRST